MTIQEEVQEVYERAYEDAKEGMAPNEVKIGVSAGGEEKVFTERNFYWCGFSWIEFAGRGKNLGLKKLWKVSPKYGGGFYLDCIQRIGNRGNGDHEIQQKAYFAVAEFLNSLGYDVRAGGRLD